MIAAMPKTADPALEEAGLDEEVVAGSISRVYGKMVDHQGDEPCGDIEAWTRVVGAATNVLGGSSEADVNIQLSELADHLRTVYGRTLDEDYEPVPAAALPEKVRLGWQAVTRHLVNVFSFDPQEARRLEQHEDKIVEFVRSRSATTK